MGTQPGNNGTLCVYGGTEMTSQNNLRERMAEIIDAALVAWNTDMDTQDSEGKYAAQAIIDGFGLRWEHQPVIGGTRKRIIGDWKGGKEGAKK